MAIPVTPPSPKLPEIMNALTPAENMKEPSITKSKSLIFYSHTPTPFNVISLKRLSQSLVKLQYAFHK